MTPWCVVLAGGVGSRFWPLSTPERPKQLLPLVSSAPMLTETLERLQPLAPPEQTLILTNAGLREQIERMAPGVPRANIIAEPKPAGTCAALAWAARTIAARNGREAVMICVHADWSIGDPAAFRKTLGRAVDLAASRHALVTVGVVPSRADPGFGYIQPGREIDTGVFQVARFVEKPNRERAAEMVAQGYLWNSGIFVWRVGDLLDEITALTPEVAPALASSGNDLDTFFATVTPVAIDVGVLERSARVLVIPGAFGWDDVGTWSALRRVRALDARGNATHGRVHLAASSGNVVHAEGNAIVLYGVEDLVVVARDGVILVTTVEQAADLKALLDSLPSDLKSG